MFTEAERDRARERVLEIARADDRVVAAAEVGSLALGGGDRYSDIDLTFAVRNDASIQEVLEDWTARVTQDLDAVRLFDLVRDAIVYRVFLLADCLQLDVSFSPASGFRPMSSRFRLIYGEAGDPLPEENLVAPAELLGWAAMYARDVRVSTERGQVWRAENSLSCLRHYALSFACARRGLTATWGKGHDELPTEVLDSFVGALTSSVEPEELTRALASAVAALRKECTRAPDVSPKLDDYLGDLLEP